MTFAVRLHPNARRDRDRALSWLDEHHPELAAAFLDDFYSSARLIAENPTLRREVRPGVRHESFGVFRYHLWFRVFEDAQVVEVFAVLHYRADPQLPHERLL